MRSTIPLWDVVGETQDAFVVAIVPLHSHFNTNVRASYAAVCVRRAFTFRIKRIGM